MAGPTPPERTKTEQSFSSTALSSGGHSDEQPVQFAAETISRYRKQQSSEWW